jgi:DNA-binding protein H-NS
MATKKAAKSDLLMQIQSLAKQKKNLESQLAKAQRATLKNVVAEFKKSLKDNRLDVEDALALLGSAKAGPKKKRAKRGSKIVIEKPYTKGVTYKKPRGSETWVGGTRGRQPPWLRELIASGRTYQSLAVKP